MNRDILLLISKRQRQILIHSCIYYRLDDSIISDYTFDKWSKELAELQQLHPEETKASVYYKTFRGFDGSTGADLPTGEPEVYSKAVQILEYHKKRERKERGS